MRPTFQQTVNVVVQAYLNDELMHGECEMCAVGNIVHAAGFPRYNRSKMLMDSCGMWKNVFCTNPDTLKQAFGNVYENGNYFIAGMRMIEATGYTTQELARVEFAFESADTGYSKDEWMFNGLYGSCRCAG
jgi:hypothetical protein